MILSYEQIKSIILKNPNKELVVAGKKYNKTLRMHFYGEHLDAELTTIDGFEKESLRSLRVKYAKSNKDLTSRLMRPVDKVFSAKGGSLYYNLPEAQDKRARQLSADIRSGYSVNAWVKDFWKPHYMDDPYGLIFMEIAPTPVAARLKQQGKSFVYPTYKSITSIFDYLPNGSSLEYVVFNVDKNEKVKEGLNPDETIYRVVDDSFDYYVKCEGEEVTILTDHSFPNLFMYVPGMLNSDIPNPNRDGGVLSFFDEALELANEFLLKGSIKKTHDFMHGFPKYWEYADSCSKCNGTGFVEANECPQCKGSGKNIMTKVSDAKILNHPQTKEDPVITPNVAGYVSPDKTYWEISTTDLQMIEELMNYTLWGAGSSQKTQGMSTSQTGESKTATEIMTEIKPQSDRLNTISESAEKRHKFIIDAVIRLQITQNYGGASVNYGRRYILENPDVIWTKYSDARAKGGPTNVLDVLLNEYYDANFQNDPIGLAIAKKLMYVEPFVHMTTLQLKALSPSEEDYKAKLYFGEWLATLNDAMILSFSTEQLREMLFEAVKSKQIAQPEKVAA